MVSVAMQDSSSAPKAMLACGMAGFRREVCLFRDVIKLSSTCTTSLLREDLAWQNSEMPTLQEIAYSAILEANTFHLHQTRVLVESPNPPRSYVRMLR